MEARSLHRTQSRNYIKNSLWELSRHVTADNIKVKDLASYSGVSRTVFYRNFGCLSDVWHSIGHDVLNDIASSQELFYTDSGQGLRENVLQNVAACIYHSKDKIQNITSEYGDPIFIPKFEKQTQIWIQQCISKSQHWEENLQQKQMASFLSQAVVHAALDGLKENNFEKLSQSFLSLDQIFYALHVKDNIVSFYDKEHS